MNRTNLTTAALISFILLGSACGCGNIARKMFGVPTTTEIKAEIEKQKIEIKAQLIQEGLVPPSKEKLKTPPIAARGLNLMMFGGAALIFLGVLTAVLFKKFQDAVIAVACGGSMMAVSMLAETYPWVIILLAIMVLIGIGYMLFVTYRGRQQQKTLQHLVTAVDTVDEAANNAVREKIKATTTRRELDLIKSVVDKTKKKLGLPTTSR